MESDNSSSDPFDPVHVPLKNPATAALLAWVWPGAGHLYQGRHAKGILFMVCILGTFFGGLTIGGGRVVYASWIKHDRRLPYLCQVGVGLPALPALVQSVRVRVMGKDPLLGGLMAPPRDVNPTKHDELAIWHERYTYLFELGTVYTMIAGLLNVLVIYDAGLGPVFVVRDEDSNQPHPASTA